MSAPAWQPMQDPSDIRHLTKLLEELGELTAAASRCLHQGMDGKEPVTGRVNRQWLEDEAADVRAVMIAVQGHFHLDKTQMAERVIWKFSKLREWLNGRPA